METYLVTWNPDRWKWDMKAHLDALRRHGFFDYHWSCGHTKSIRRGDQIFLLRQGREPRGVCATGLAVGEPYFAKHWDPKKRGKALYIDIRFDSLLEPERDGVLPLSELGTGELKSVNWRTQSSGIRIAADAAAELENLWKKFLAERGQSPIVLADEVTSPSRFYEGATRIISVNTYERDPRAREACINHYGAVCSICGFDFARVYGKHGRGYIHVHHIVPISTIGKTYVVDPVADLRPVCPNCHAMLHRGDKVLSPSELKAMLQTPA